MKNLEVIITRDGSHSILNTALNETYHSTHGAVQESIYVFIKSGLEFYLQKTRTTSLQILEVGFGTGLNALLTLQYATQQSIDITFTSLEAFPLTSQTWNVLNYGKTLSMSNEFQLLHQVNWNELISITDKFTLHKMHATLETADLPQPHYDIIYFDAFAPSKQPELWEFPILEKVVSFLKPGGVFVTYCAKGQVKRDLKALGLLVETLPGPPGKKEMIRAVRA